MYYVELYFSNANAFAFEKNIVPHSTLWIFMDDIHALSLSLSLYILQDLLILLYLVVIRLWLKYGYRQEIGTVSDVPLVFAVTGCC